MTYEEYKKDLTDQIGNKRAKQLVKQEIDNHIEELTGSLEEDGMEHGAALVLIALFAFCVYSLYMSLKQSNRISFLFGSMCSVTLLLRSLFYVLNNFGLVLNYSTYFPFLKYGLGNALVNGCYIGIIMCVYRNSNILGERTVPVKEKVLGGRQAQ